MKIGSKCWTINEGQPLQGTYKGSTGVEGKRYVGVGKTKFVRDHYEVFTSEAAALQHLARLEKNKEFTENNNKRVAAERRRRAVEDKFFVKKANGGRLASLGNPLESGYAQGGYGFVGEFTRTRPSATVPIRELAEIIAEADSVDEYKRSGRRGSTSSSQRY
jgi:hypothetical protein